MINLDLLEELCMVPGIPGNEHRVRNLIEDKVSGLCDDMYTDDMGNLHCVVNGKHPEDKVVMLACHMDEIGFIVNYIDDEGFVYVQPLGGFDPRNLFSRRVTVSHYDAKNDESLDYPGVMNPAGLPIHLSKPEDRKNIPAADEFVIDLGFDANGKISIGDMVTMNEPFEVMGTKVVSKALDNRIACYLGIRVLEDLHLHGDNKYATHVVFTVQEEVGLRGAKTAAHIVQPDLAIGVDVTLSCDTPGVPKNKHVTTQGKGCAIGVRDASFVSDKDMRADLIDLCEINLINYQEVVSSGGGMDGAAMQQAGIGCKAIAVSVGTRYIHTVTEMVDMQDLIAAEDLLTAYLSI
jgi:putative aminopeptidase FrvX